MEDNRIQMANSRIKGTMAEFERRQVEFAMVQAEISRSMADMDYSQVGFPKFRVQDEIRPYPQEIMTNLEETMDEL